MTTIPEKPVDLDEIRAARDTLVDALLSLTGAIDNPPAGLKSDELDLVRCRRSNQMHEAAVRLNNLINGRRTR